MTRKESRLWIFAGLLLGTSLCLSLGLYAYNLTQGAHTAGSTVSTNWFPSVQAIDRIRAELSQLRRAGTQVVMAGRRCDPEACRRRIEEVKRNLTRAEAVYAPLVTPREETVLFEAYRRERATYLNIQDQIIASTHTSGGAAVERFMAESEDAYDNATGTLTRLAVFNGEQGALAHAAASADYAKAQASLVVLNLVFLVAAVVLAAMLLRGATRPEAQASRLG